MTAPAEWPWADALAVARSLRDAGGSPIPLGPKKKPALPEWKPFQTRRATDEELQAWFGDGNPRRHRIGLVTGAISGAVVIDGDNARKNGRQQRGSRELAMRGAWNPPTRWRQTPSGGVHVFYAHPGGQVPNSEGADGWFGKQNGTRDVDVRGDGGYVVWWAPGYRTRADGPPAPLPEWARPHATTNGDGDAFQRSHLTDLLTHPPTQGERNGWFAAVCGHYAKRFPERDAYDLHVWKAAELLPAGDDPVSDAEITKVAGSIWHSEEGRFEREVEKRAWVMQVNDEARRRVRAVGFTEPPAPLTGAELLAIDYGPQRWAIGELLGAGSNALLAGQYKAGKTVLLLNIIRAWCDGAPLLDRFGVHAPADRTVGYFNYELTDRQLQEWISRLDLRHPERLVVENLRGNALHLGEPEANAWAARWLQQARVGLWIIDPFARAYGGSSENDNTEVGRFAEAIDVTKQLAGVDSSILAAHFGRKSFEAGDEHARGATRLDDWADARWIMTRQGDDRYLAADGRDVDVREARLAFDRDTLHLTMLEGSRRVHKQSAVEGAVMERVQAVVAQFPPAAWHEHLSQAAICRAITGDDKLIRAALQGLVEADRLDRIELGGSRHGAFLHLPPGTAYQGVFG